MEGLASLARSLGTFLQLWPILLTLGSTLTGILIGCMPGLSATLGIALLTTLTIKMPPGDAILILIGAYIGAIYGGSRTAILLNIPGTAANAAACLDGYALARQGQAGRAVGQALPVDRDDLDEEQERDRDDDERRSSGTQRHQA